jgi:hypothetical protein
MNPLVSVLPTNLVNFYFPIGDRTLTDAILNSAEPYYIYVMFQLSSLTSAGKMVVSNVFARAQLNANNIISMCESVTVSASLLSTTQVDVAVGFVGTQVSVFSVSTPCIKPFHKLRGHPNGFSMSFWRLHQTFFCIAFDSPKRAGRLGLEHGHLPRRDAGRAKRWLDAGRHQELHGTKPVVCAHHSRLEGQLVHLQQGLCVQLLPGHRTTVCDSLSGRGAVQHSGWAHPIQQRLHHLAQPGNRQARARVHAGVFILFQCIVCAWCACV